MGRVVNEQYEPRKNHILWCKNRALECIKEGDIANAYLSFISDMSKHPETRNHIALELGTQMFLAGMLNSEMKMKNWIEGFN